MILESFRGNALSRDPARMADRDRGKSDAPFSPNIIPVFPGEWKRIIICSDARVPLRPNAWRRLTFMRYQFQTVRHPSKDAQVHEPPEHRSSLEFFITSSVKIYSSRGNALYMVGKSSSKKRLWMAFTVSRYLCCSNSPIHISWSRYFSWFPKKRPKK